MLMAFRWMRIVLYMYLKSSCTAAFPITYLSYWLARGTPYLVQILCVRDSLGKSPLRKDDPQHKNGVFAQNGPKRAKYGFKGTKSSFFGPKHVLLLSTKKCCRMSVLLLLFDFCFLLPKNKVHKRGATTFCN